MEFETVNILDSLVIVHGSDGDDQTVCSTGSGILGAPINDVLRGYGGSDLQTGGMGMDTAAYAGIRRQYWVSMTSVSGGPKGRIDTLVSIEELWLVDGVLSFDISGIPDEVMRLYDAALDRGPDQAGLEFNAGLIEAGSLSLIARANAFVASAFAASPEFQARYGALSNQAYVEQLYRFCLDREGDPAGIAFHVAALNGGKSRGELLFDFSESPEHIALTAPLWSGGIRTIDSTFNSAPTGADGNKHLDHGPQVLVLADDASSDAKTVGVAQVNPALVAYDPADIVIDFKSADDAFVLPALDGLSPMVVSMPDATEAGPLSPLDRLTALSWSSDHALKVIHADDGNLDHPPPTQETGHDDGG
ncbi:MAG: hypothetical protein DCF28_03795 [Alphaproteobacteria bacterium]|nr:MAG: hypothetical protein DCF28_03795 [Alphaproteobacteria bacterium]PZO40270.1 MAG: hypothetical protein DCE92_02590 [Alphaproteobacteria bacterium]